MRHNNTENEDVFSILKQNVLDIDPIIFCENHLTIDGKPFKLNGTGYKPFADIYRYICLKAVQPNTKPVVLVKGRQVGATTMAAALECYFAACGIYGNNGRPAMRIMHLFPTLALAGAYTKDKLDTIISQSNPVPGALKNNGLNKSYMESFLDTSSPSNNNMYFKKFLGGNQVWIDSPGLTGDRVRGKTVDAVFFDECFPYNQYIQTINGKIKIGDLYSLFKNKKTLPLVKSFNLKNNKFEFKKILNVWKKKERELVTVLCSNYKIECTPEHLFLTNHGWVKAENLVGYFVFSSENGWELVKNVIHNVKKEIVYDIEVEDNHNFIACGENVSDGLLVHNCQDITGLAIGAATKVLTQAKYGTGGQGVQVYFGTPKQKGGPYYNMWKSSNQQYFHLHCENCEEYFPLYRPDINWEDVWLYGFIVKCTKCGHEQNKNDAAERGKWIGLVDESDAKMIGYHINQLYIPQFPKEVIVGQKPEEHPTNTERIYMNEVLGEFYDSAGGTISRQEIIDNCAEIKRPFAKSISPSNQLRVYAGFDWGQKANWDIIAGKRQGQSYSCAVILTAQGPELFNIEFATRLMKNDLDDKLEVVEEMFRRFSVKQAVGDIGDANDLTSILQQKYGDAFLCSRAQFKIKGHIAYKEDVFPKEIIFERDYYMSELFSLLRKGAIKFPFANEERISWLVDHCASMDIKITQDKSGEPIRRFVKGSAPNDGFMALLNAYLAWKWDVSQKFSIKNPTYMKFDMARNGSTMGPILGYCPKL